MTDNLSKTPDFILQAIRGELKRKADDLVSEAKEELEKRAPEITARVVVEVMKMFEFQSHSDRIVFTIKKN